jgi:hypothetical protein
MYGRLLTGWMTRATSFGRSRWFATVAPGREKLRRRSVPAQIRKDRMAGFAFKLEREDGIRADPPTLHAAVPNWRAGHVIA